MMFNLFDYRKYKIYLFMSIQANQLTKAIHIAIIANMISLKRNEDSKNESWIR